MKNIYFINGISNNPYFNLASEDYLLNNKEDYYVYIWVNSPACIIGVNQNAYSELNIKYCKDNDIKIVRRLTGGGAVYHDLNNICYTFIGPYDSSQNNFTLFLTPVVNYLKSIGLNASFSGRNDILLDDKKISGNAQTIKNGRILVHGTLLFKVDSENLSNALNPNFLKLQSKGIKSVKSRVTCVSNYSNISFEDFKLGLTNYLRNSIEEYSFTKEDIESINSLVKNKYILDSWNLGNSPKGSFTIKEKFSFGYLEISYDIIDSKLFNVEIKGDYFEIKPIEEFENKFNGLYVSKETLIPIITKVKEYILNSNEDEIINKIL